MQSPAKVALVCLAIPACDCIVGHFNRHLHSNGHTKLLANNLDIWEGKLWLEGFLGF
jgi:hypothetical protein